MNIVLLFALRHRVIAEALPEAYTHLPAPDDQAACRAVTVYGSFITLTSAGHGGMIPLHPLVRSLANEGGGHAPSVPSEGARQRRGHAYDRESRATEVG